MNNVSIKRVIDVDYFLHSNINKEGAGLLDKNIRRILGFLKSRATWIGYHAQAFAFLRWRNTEYEKALSTLPRISGPALVVGSAPNAQKPAGVDESWFRVSANASQVVLDKFGLPGPSLTVFGPRILTNGEAQNAYWPILKDRGTEHLVALMKTEDDRRLRRELPDKDYEAQVITEMEYCTKVTIIVETTGRHLITFWGGSGDISNGLFAALLALKLGATKVVMTGFSLDKGWAYAPHLNGKRTHVRADTLTCQTIREKGLPIYAADQEFAKVSGLQLWS